MAQQPTPETQSKVASDAAENFVAQYYDALNSMFSKRNNPTGSTSSSTATGTLDRFYVSASAKLTAASVIPDISVNGKNLNGSVSDLETLLRSQGVGIHYDVGSWDAQPVNPDFRLGLPEHMHQQRGADRELRNGDRMSFAVQVSGTVKFGSGRAGGAEGSTAAAAAILGSDVAANGAAAAGGPVEMAFNESWLLVPHWEAHGRHAPRGLRKWLVVSQNYRTL